MLCSNYEFTEPTACTIRKMEGAVKDKGNNIGSKNNISFAECTEICLADENCNSFSRNLYDGKRNCYFKDKKLDGSEPIAKKNDDFFSAYKVCPKGDQFLTMHSINLMTSNLLVQCIVC